MEQEDLKLFGIDQETLDKSKDILPVFDLSKDLQDREEVIFTVLSDKPELVEHKDIFAVNDKGKKIPDATKKTGIISVEVIYVNRIDQEGKMFRVDYNHEKFNIWLSSKSFSSGLARIMNKYDTLKELTLKVKKGRANYKLGENVCYTVSELEVNE